MISLIKFSACIPFDFLSKSIGNHNQPFQCAPDNDLIIHELNANSLHYRFNKIAKRAGHVASNYLKEESDPACQR